VEVSGESTFFYSRAPHALLQALEARSGLRVLHRPADLEDVFLKFTGREIREAA
jgi:lipooligosaccharide transport system ATP-binding protein